MSSTVCMHGEGPDCAACARLLMCKASGKENAPKPAEPKAQGKGKCKPKPKSKSKPQVTKAKAAPIASQGGSTAKSGATAKPSTAKSAKRPRTAKGKGKDAAAEQHNQPQLSAFFGQGRLTGKSARRDNQREANLLTPPQAQPSPPAAVLAQSSAPLEVLFSDD